MANGIKLVYRFNGDSTSALKVVLPWMLIDNTFCCRYSPAGAGAGPVRARMTLRKTSMFFAASMAMLDAPAPSLASQYEFLAAPQINLSLVYRVDKLSGDVVACQFAHNPGRTDVGPGAFGVTSCYRGGEGATKQDPGEYGLIATRHEQEGGVFRVNYRTGGLSICYLYFQREKQGDHESIADQYVVCTPEWK